MADERVELLVQGTQARDVLEVEEPEDGNEDLRNVSQTLHRVFRAGKQMRGGLWTGDVRTSSGSFASVPRLSSRVRLALSTESPRATWGPFFGFALPNRRRTE